MKKTINIIQTTHWDYEWYFTNEQSNIQFVFFMKELLQSFDKNIISNFILDGQMGIVEKYLKSFPEDFKKIKKLNNENKLKIGPWFTQTDQMIISGESIVKNLYLGHKIAKPLGGAWKIGYVPDAFGQAKNMPKIYNGFDINRFVFWRGLSDGKHNLKEFIWKSDGCKVDALNIKEGYYSGGVFFWGDKKQISNTLEKIATKTLFKDENIISLGGDQRYIDLNVNEKINELKNTIPDTNFRLSTYEHFFKKYDDVRNELKIISGEFLDSQDSKIHRSIYSHRYDHKYLNDYNERLITYVLEPLAAIASEAGIESNVNLIENAWRLLLLNSAHDSAGGCNSDLTNFHITDRFFQAKEIIESYIDVLIRKLSESIYKKNDIVFFNTQPYKKNIWSNIQIITKNKNFMLLDNNKKVEFEINNVEKVYYGSILRNGEIKNPEMFYYKHNVTIDYFLEPLSFKSIKVIEITKPKNLVNWTKKSFIENENFKVVFNKSNMTVLDKKNNKKYSNFIKFVSDVDDGDTYDWSPLKNIKEITIQPTIKNISSINNALSSRLIIEGFLPINRDIKEWGKSLPKTKINKFTLEVILNNKSNDVDFKLKIKNESKDHRLRMRFNTNINYEESIADTHFGFIKRPLKQKELINWKKLNWKEEPSGIYPVLSTLVAKGKKNQISFLLKGIKEYEFEKGGNVNLTLYRSIGWLGKPDLLRRPGKASGQEFKYIATPDSQLLTKELEWNFKVLFEKLSLAQIKKESVNFSTKETYYQNQEYDRFTGPLKYFVSNKWQSELKKDCKLFEDLKINKNINISIIKQIDKNNILLRYFSVNNKKVKEPIKIEFNYSVNIHEANLNEEIKNTIIKNKRFAVLPELKNNEIKTIIIERK